MLKGFRDFILRGNVVDLAVGLLIGASFGAVVNSLVKGVLTPLIAAIFKQPDFSAVAVSVRGTPILFGEFLNATVSFIVSATVIYFFVIIPLNKIMLSIKGPVTETTKKCPECLSSIPLQAKRCAFCTSVVS